jgi:hypothetical protein
MPLLNIIVWEMKWPAIYRQGRGVTQKKDHYYSLKIRKKNNFLNKSELNTNLGVNHGGSVQN